MDLLALALLAALTAKPLLAPGQARTHEMERSPLRAQQMHVAHTEGQWWPRWAPDLAGGYGYPLFNFYAPLSMLVIEACHLVGGLDWPGAAEAATAALSLLAAWGMWGFGQVLWRWPGGLIAGTAFLFLPHRLSDALMRGAVAELAAMALLPWALWALIATLRRGGGARAAGLAAAWALVVLSHNITALFAAPVLLGVLLIVALGEGPPRGRAALAGAGLLLGTGMSALFWWPALAERTATALRSGEITRLYYDYHLHFLTPWQLFRPVVSLHGLSNGRTDDPMPLEIGNAALLLALLGLAQLWRLPRRRVRALVTAMAGMTAVLGFLMTTASQPIWERVPLMAYAQFPWRLLALTGVLVSALAGGCVAGVARRGWRPVALAAAAVALLATAELPLLRVRAPVLYPADFFSRPGLRRIYKTTSGVDEFLPASAQRSTLLRLTRPRPGEVLLPGSAGTVTDVVFRTGEIRFRASVPEATDAVVGVLAFPGWQARIDGERARVGVEARTGLLMIALPAGADLQVTAWLGLTRVQRWATAASGLSVAATLLLAAGGALLRRREARGR